MTDDIKKAGDTGSAVHIAHHLASSDSFQSLFQEGMSLVEETAMYLDGNGREEAKQLPRPASPASPPKIMNEREPEGFSLDTYAACISCQTWDGSVSSSAS